jgi:hypothetical protein
MAQPGTTFEDRPAKETFVLGAEDVNQLFELQPEKRIGTDFDEATKELVCLITHKRDFNNPTPMQAEGGYKTDHLDQCILKFE